MYACIYIYKDIARKTTLPSGQTISKALKIYMNVCLFAYGSTMVGCF